MTAPSSADRFHPCGKGLSLRTPKSRALFATVVNPRAVTRRCILIMFTQPLKKQPRRLTRRSHTSDDYDNGDISSSARPRYRIASYRHWPSTRADRLPDVLCIADRLLLFSHYVLSCRIQHIFSVTCLQSSRPSPPPPLTCMSLSLLPRTAD